VQKGTLALKQLAKRVEPRCSNDVEPACHRRHQFTIRRRPTSSAALAGETEPTPNGRRQRPWLRKPVTCKARSMSPRRSEAFQIEISASFKQSGFAITQYPQHPQLSQDKSVAGHGSAPATLRMDSWTRLSLRSSKTSPCHERYLKNSS